VEVPESVLIRGFKVKRNINNRDRQDKKDKVKIFGVWKSLMFGSYGFILYILYIPVQKKV